VACSPARAFVGICWALSAAKERSTMIFLLLYVLHSCSDASASWTVSWDKKILATFSTSVAVCSPLPPPRSI
jgi:hypothetical protein